MIRSNWKIKYNSLPILKYLEEEEQYPTDVEKMSPFRLYQRHCNVPENLVEHKFAIHTGREFERVVINENQIKLKFGSLVLTKEIGIDIHNTNKIQKKKKDRMRLLKQKKLNRNKIGKKARLKKSQKFMLKRKEQIKKQKQKEKDI